MRITMIGAGYVGLVSGACFADFGHDVTCVDKDKTKIGMLQDGKMPIFEPGLDNLVRDNVREGRLSFSENAASISESKAVFIAVGTPSRRGDGHADLDHVRGAAEEIIDRIERYTVVVTKSTVPVGAGDEVEKLMRERRPEKKQLFSVVSNPEFLREGAAINDFKRPDRIVVGAEDDKAREVMRELYRPLFLNETPILFTSRRTAELTKYAANAFLAMKITYINEMADLCEAVGANVQEVARGIGLDNRIGGKFLHAGPGYGGSCFPKDTLALVKTADDHKSPLRLVKTTVDINEERKGKMARKVIDALGGRVSGKTIAVLGLTFKPNTDDMRDAPSIHIINALIDAGANVRATGPEGGQEARRHPQLQNLERLTFVESGPYECIKGADAVAIVTEWDQFRALDLEKVKPETATIVDLRNIYNPAEMRARGFQYTSVGRPEPRDETT